MNQEAHWLKAVMERDRRYDGEVYYGVSSTGVFCRPSCPSRRPLHKNIRLFSSPVAARMAGFRPCLRCRPEQDLPADLLTVHEACRRMAEAGDEAPLLMSELADELGLSERHLRQLFVNHFGVSPQQFYHSLRINKLRQALAQGQDISEAIFSAGFNSASRAYNEIGQRLGMTPSSYRKGGQGQVIAYQAMASSMGEVLVAGTERGLCSIQLGDDAGLLLQRLRAEFPHAQLEEGGDALGLWAQALVDYIDGRAAWPLLPLDLQATAFQARVWQALRNIPAGQTLSYQAIAQQLGLEQGARAVARACASNPVALAVPCHRAVRRDGSPTAFRWGAERKQALLRHERDRTKDEGSKGR